MRTYLIDREIEFVKVRFDCLLSKDHHCDTRQVSEILEASVSSSIKLVITVLPFMIVVRFKV